MIGSQIVFDYLRIKCAEINQMETASSPFGPKLKIHRFLLPFVFLLVAERCETPRFVSIRTCFCVNIASGTLNTLNRSRREKSKRHRLNNTKFTFHPAQVLCLVPHFAKATPKHSLALVQLKTQRNYLSSTSVSISIVIVQLASFHVSSFSLSRTLQSAKSLCLLHIL